MNLLLIDNDPIFLKFVENFLIEEGHTVKTAKDGLSALEVLESFSPDIFFVDYVMPNIDGKAFCQLLRNNPKHESSYLVLLSAVAAEEWTDLKNIGADACIAKGPLNKMKGYILAVLDNQESSAEYCASGRIIGLEDVFPRLITRELLDSKKHFQLLLEKMSEGILQLNSEYRIVFANPAAQTILNQSGNTILGRPLSAMFPSDQSKSIMELMKAKGRGQTLRGPDNPMIINNQFLTFSVVPLLSEESHSLVIINDISDHKLAENKLKETNDFLASILNSAYSISIISTDLDQNILFWNQGAEDIFGYTEDEVVGKQKIDILYPGSQEKKQADDLRQFLQRDKKAVSCELIEITKGGQSLWIKLHVSPRIDENGTVAGILGIGEDITQQKGAEEAVLESEKRFRMLSDLAEEGIAIHEQGIIVDANESMARTFGYELPEIIGMSIEKLVIPASWEAILKNIAAEYDKHYEGIGVRKDGSTFHYLLAGRSYHYHGKSLRVANFRDISKRKNLENQLHQAQKMESLGTLAGGVAHDFNNLLMGIQGRTSLIKMSPDSSPSLFEHLAGIEECVKSAATLTKQLLGFARGGKYEVKAIDLNELVKSQCRMFGRTRKDITIYEKYEKNLWAVEVDPGQIEQVLLNIFVNAWQAMPKSGDLYIQSVNSVIDENLSEPYSVRPGQYTKISITDTGLGMDAEVLERIFDPFFTTKEIGRGTGLGLASVYGIINNHGGFIDVSSEIDRGSTFNIYLPASKKEVVAENKPHEKILKGNETVLFVDDEELIVNVGHSLLEILGYDVLVATSGKEALKIYKISANKIDLVILDMIMPEMDGSEIYKKLKALNPDVKVLLSSGYSINGQASEIIKMGCDGFIQKPFNMGELSTKIRDILD